MLVVDSVIRLKEFFFIFFIFTTVESKNRLKGNSKVYKKSLQNNISKVCYKSWGKKKKKEEKNSNKNRIWMIYYCDLQPMKLCAVNGKFFNQDCDVIVLLCWQQNFRNWNWNWNFKLFYFYIRYRVCHIRWTWWSF